VKKTSAFVFAGITLLTCAVFSLGMLLFGPSAAGANERLAGSPRLMENGRWNSGFLSELSDYISDRFYLRQEMITARNRTYAILNSSTVEDVILGKEGWLYYAPTLKDYCGTDRLSGAELAGAARNLGLMREYCESIGADFLFVPAPNKNSLYAEYMSGYTAAETNDVQLLFERLKEQGTGFADLYSAFREQEEILYFAHDSHWNSRGAALAADVINASLGRTSAYYSAPFPTVASHGGDLYEMLYPAADDPETDPVYGSQLAYARQGSDTRPDSITIRTSGGKNGVLLAFRDSFGNSLYPYLADSFAETRFSRMTAYDLTLAEEMGADCVVVELVERNLPYLLQNVPVMPAPARPDPGREKSAGDLILTREVAGKAPAGCVLLSGRLPESSEGPVYISDGSRAFEAFLLADGGFAAYLPEDMQPCSVAAGAEERRMDYTVAEIVMP